MDWRAYVEHDFARLGYRVHLAHRDAVLRPVDLVMEVVPAGVETPPAFTLDEGAARALYDALGRALNIHTPDARLAAEVLKREQARVDKFIDFVVKEESDGCSA